MSVVAQLVRAIAFASILIQGAPVFGQSAIKESDEKAFGAYMAKILSSDDSVRKSMDEFIPTSNSRFWSKSDKRRLWTYRIETCRDSLKFKSDNQFLIWCSKFYSNNIKEYRIVNSSYGKKVPELGKSLVQILSSDIALTFHVVERGQREGWAKSRKWDVGSLNDYREAICVNKHAVDPTPGSELYIYCNEFMNKNYGGKSMAERFVDDKLLSKELESNDQFPDNNAARKEFLYQYRSAFCINESKNPSTGSSKIKSYCKQKFPLFYLGDGYKSCVQAYGNKRCVAIGEARGHCYAINNSGNNYDEKWMEIAGLFWKVFDIPYSGYEEAVNNDGYNKEVYSEITKSCPASIDKISRRGVIGIKGNTNSNSPVNNTKSHDKCKDAKDYEGCLKYQ